MGAILKYKNKIESLTRDEAEARQALMETKSRLVDLQNISKNMQKQSQMMAASLKRKMAALTSGAKSSRRKSDEAERAASRVTDVKAVLRRTADGRHDRYNQQKSASFSSAWVQSILGLPSALKKSLWHKMHRRKQPIILRPTEETFVSELRVFVAHKVASRINLHGEQKRELLESEMNKAEGLFLLATHPLADSKLPSTPTSNSSEKWAEPGWQLVLDVPEDDRPGRLLPCAPSFPIMERNLSEMASAPGRQASSFLRASHLQCLASPLSAFAVASSPAETESSLSQTCK
jgi:hypothetical protein